MEYQVIPRDEHMEVEFRANTQEQEALFNAYMHYCHDTPCTEAECGHRTDQYMGLARIGIDPMPGGVRLRLEPLPGAHLTPEQVEGCVSYLIGQAYLTL